MMIDAVVLIPAITGGMIAGAALCWSLLQGRVNFWKSQVAECKDSKHQTLLNMLNSINDQNLRNRVMEMYIVKDAESAMVYIAECINHRS